MQKRGQVTIFIVLGIVILVVFGLLFFLKGKVVESSFEDEMNALAVPAQLEPVKEYLDVCLRDVTRDGIRLMGEQGGYIEIPEDNDFSYGGELSNSLKLGPSGEVAFWYYETSNGIDVERIPTLDEMENQLEEYINEHFKDCFYFLSSFEKEGFEFEYPESAVSEVDIGLHDIKVKVISSVYVKLKDVNKDIDKHMVLLDSNFGEMYELAKQIMKKEDEDLFLEEKTIDMMGVYDEIPFSETEFSCEKKIWNKNDVVKDMKKIFSTNMAALRLKNPTSSAFLGENKDYFEIDLVKPEYISESFNYFEDWPMEVDVSPTKGDILVGDPLTQEVPEISKFLNLFFCLNNYHFVYDVKYPVLISLLDENGDGFQFATLVKIDNNKPRQYEGEVLNFEDVNKFEKEFCENKAYPVSVDVFDYDNLRPIEGASVLYKCFIASCYIGETDENGRLEAMFPPCLNGMVIAQKQGYEIGFNSLSSNVENDSSVYLDKIYNLGLDVKQLYLSDGYESRIDNDKEAIIQFENLDDGYVTMVTDEDDEIKLTAGNYRVTEYLLATSDGGISFGDETVTQCVEVPKPGVLGLFMKEKKCIESEIEGGTMEDVISGGAVFEWYADINEEDSKLTIYVPYDVVPRTQSEMLEVFNNININKDNPNFRYPELE